MSTRRGIVRPLLLVLLAAAAGAAFGDFLRQHEAIPGSRLQRLYPLPHQIPKYPGGVALRFAMVHDVIHERFPRHGKAYYRERNRLAREGIAQEKASNPGGKPSARYFALLDDLGAGLDYLGEHDEAVRVLRGKLQEQQAAGRKGRDLYTTYANLGTFLIHGSFKKAQQGDPAAKERLREGLQFIHKSIEVNPEAHFGREIWQAVTAEFLLAAMEDKRILLKYDLAGNQLDEAVSRGTAMIDGSPRKAEGYARAVADYLADPKSPRVEADLRQTITRIGSPDAASETKTSQKEPVAFDEPVLGVIGMWRLGGGANPHFALMLGETMYRVGQRHIAWCAYERAAGLADRFWPDAAIQKKFVEHCRARQRAILDDLPPGERDTLPRRFEVELAHGLRYQEAYQNYEKEKIAAGGSLDDPPFYDDFHARHGPIASPPGDADSLVVEKTAPGWDLAGPLFCAGVFGLAAALLLRFRAPSAGKSSGDSSSA
jgi:hypothetical protein